jgi:Aerotolerance regulator N-terminal/von Willebrand factor type A domain
MGFFAPWFLAGIAAIGLPFWIHLLRRHKNVPQPFSSLMFFERRTQSSVKHRRLRYLALLSLRAAMLLLLALLFANPFIDRAGIAGSGRKLTVIAVDNSFSMRYGDHLTRAKREAMGVIGGLRGGDLGEVVAVGSHVDALTEPTGDLDSLRAAIQSIEPGDSTSSYAEFARFLRGLPQSVKMPVEAHFFSDLQKSAMPARFADLRLPPDAVLIPHPISDTPEGNWAVESVSAPSKVYTTKNIVIHATVAGYGTEAAHRTASLVMNGRVIDTKSVDVPANGRAQVQFTAFDASYGFNRGEVRVDGDDPLQDDNRFYFSVERSDPGKVLFIHDERDPVLFYKSALEAAADQSFDLDPVTPQQAENVSFSRYAFVVLSGVSELPGSLEGNLRDYVNRGGGLLIALGYTAPNGRVPVTGDRIIGSEYSSREGDQFQTAAKVDTTHPVLAKTNGLEGVKFYRALRVEEGKSRVLARLSDETPLLLDRRMGEGRVLIFTSTLDNVSNDFPLHASFVPFVEQSAQYLEGVEDRVTNVAVGSYIELRKQKNRGAAVEVLDPAGKRALSLKEQTTAQNFQVTEEGYYDVRTADGKHHLIAVNADRRESDLAPIPEETLALWRGGPAGTPAQHAAAGAVTLVPHSFWKYILGLLLLVSLAESIVADRFTSAVKEVAQDSGPAIAEDSYAGTGGLR